MQEVSRPRDSGILEIVFDIVEPALDFDPDQLDIMIITMIVIMEI